MVFFDYNHMCLVRRRGQVEEKSTMVAGPDGFAVAVFPDSMQRVTTITNLELFQDSKVLKRPAACMKRPAAEMKISSVEPDKADDSGNEEASESEQEQPEQPVKAPQKRSKADVSSCNKMTLSSGHQLKLGLYRDKSYITYLAPGAEKYTLLVNISAEQANRNGKNHQEIMERVWQQLKMKSDLPEKAGMKGLVLQLLAQ
jgi:hypothetical protein